MKEKYKIWILITFVIIVFITACDKEENSEVVIEKSLPSYTSLKFIGAFKVFLYQSDTDLIRIEGIKKFAENVNYNYDEYKRLVISNDAEQLFIEPESNVVTLHIYFKNMNTIRSNSACYLISLDTLEVDRFTLIFTQKINEADLLIKCNEFNFFNQHPSGGLVRISGETNFFNVWCSGLAHLNAVNFKAKKANIKTNSKADCDIYVTDQLTYSIEGTGNINLYGNPYKIIKETVNSTGVLVEMN